MSLLEVFQLVGYSLGALLPLWMGYLLLRQRLGLVSIQRLLLALAVCIGAWHGSNLIITLHNLLGLESGGRAILLRLADTVAVISITACYSLLLHIHLHFWADTRSRRLKLSERVRLYLSYVPCVFLVLAVPRIWTEGYRPMLVKLAP